MNYFFPISEDTDVEEYYGRAYGEYLGCKVDTDLIALIEQKFRIQDKNVLKRVISTQIGKGPELLANEFEQGVSLMDESGYIL